MKTAGKILAGLAVAACSVFLVAAAVAWISTALESLKRRAAARRGGESGFDVINAYYREHGRQCRRCGCWLPMDMAACPACIGDGLPVTRYCIEERYGDIEN